MGNGFKALAAAVLLSSCASEPDRTEVQAQGASVMGEVDAHSEETLGWIITQVRENLAEVSFSFVLALGSFLLGRRTRRVKLKEAVEGVLADKVQISFHTFSQSGTDTVLHIERAGEHSYIELFGEFADFIEKATQQRLHASASEQQVPFLSFPEEIRTRAQWVLKDRLIAILRGVTALGVTEHISSGREILYADYLVALTVEAYTDQASPRRPRVVLIPVQAACPIEPDGVRCEPGQEHQALRVETHNLMVADHALSEPEHTFIIKVPVSKK